MDMQKEREAFEEYLTDAGLVEFAGYGFSVDECDEYLHEPTNVAWQSWVEGLRRAAKARAVPEWISVKDQLPNEDDQVLAYGVNSTVGMMETIWVDEFDDWNISHWMPLPDKPKAQDQS